VHYFPHNARHQGDREDTYFTENSMSKPMAELRMKLTCLHALCAWFYKPVEVLLLISIIPESGM